MERSVFEQSVQLPADFADKLLEFEMRLEKQCEVDLIRSLVDLYSVKTIQNAIEYYESVKDHKFQAYHKRLQALLIREDVQEVLCSTIKGTRKALNEISINIAEKQFSDSSKEAANSRTQALNNIKTQEDTIEVKLKRRKSLRALNSSADHSAGSRDQYENTLVEVMEKYLTAKITQTQEIRNTYEGQMKEIQEMGNNSIIFEILKQMQVSMLNEISVLSKDIEAQKAAAIVLVKNGYGIV